MAHRCLHLVLISTPIGALGSGRGGGVELTLRSLVQGLLLSHVCVVLRCLNIEHSNECITGNFTGLVTGW